jgi:hypothetical protein
MNFGVLNEFTGTLNRKLILGKRENVETVMGRFSARGCMALARPRGENGRSAHAIRCGVVAARRSRVVARLSAALRWPPRDEVYAKLTREPRGWRQATRERQGLTVVVQRRGGGRWEAAWRHPTAVDFDGGWR